MGGARKALDTQAEQKAKPNERARALSGDDPYTHNNPSTTTNRTEGGSTNRARGAR